MRGGATGVAGNCSLAISPPLLSTLPACPWRRTRRASDRCGAGGAGVASLLLDGRCPRTWSACASIASPVTTCMPTALSRPSATTAGMLGIRRVIALILRSLVAGRASVAVLRRALRVSDGGRAAVVRRLAAGLHPRTRSPRIRPPPAGSRRCLRCASLPPRNPRLTIRRLATLGSPCPPRVRLRSPGTLSLMGLWISHPRRNYLG